MRSLFITLLLLLAGDAALAGVYKWVDENGRVHYGDRPDSPQADSIELRALTPPAEPPGQDRASRQQRLLDTLEEDRLQRREQRLQAEASKAEQQRRCNIARDRLRRFESAGFLYDLDQAGDRRVLAPAERRRHTARAQAAVERWCR